MNVLLKLLLLMAIGSALTLFILYKILFTQSDFTAKDAQHLLSLERDDCLSRECLAHYSLNEKVEPEAICPNNCSGNGKCVSDSSLPTDICVCYEGFMGGDCSEIYEWETIVV